MTSDRYQRLRDALAAGPTPGSWEYREVDGLGAVAHPAGWVEAVQASGERECIDATYIAAADPDTIAALLAEHDRLVACLKGANEQAAHFEREWYLRGDEIEKLTAEREQLAKQAEAWEVEARLRGAALHKPWGALDALRQQLAKLQAERDALREALTVARDYVAADLDWLRDAYRGYETAGQVPETERDLASIDAVLAMGEGNE